MATVLFASDQGSRQAPSYSATTIVNLASGRAGELAPNTLAVIYGHELATVTRARQDTDLQGGLLPTVLPGTGVTVKVNRMLAGLEYVSPEAVVFVVPAELLAGPATVVVTRNGLSGPTAKVTLQALAPALLPYEDGWVLARRGGQGAWVTAEQPARPGEEVVLFATGMGPTNPPQEDRKVAAERDTLAMSEQLTVIAEGQELSGGQIGYAGVSPGTVGIYEVRFVLPAGVGPNPRIRVRLGGWESADGPRLRAEDGSTPPELEQ